MGLGLGLGLGSGTGLGLRCGGDRAQAALGHMTHVAAAHAHLHQRERGQRVVGSRLLLLLPHRTAPRATPPHPFTLAYTLPPS